MSESFRPAMPVVDGHRGRIHAVGGSQLEPLREIALSLPGVNERLSHGAPCFFDLPNGRVGLLGTALRVWLHDQMYSSAMAPLLHRATVTMRPPPSNSPTTHVHSPDPNLIGCDVICGGVPPAEST